MRNFDYLKQLGLDELHRLCAVAEENQVSNPDLCAIHARKALEYMVVAIYSMKHIEIKEKTSLFQLVDGEPFKNFINDNKVMMAVHYVRKVGNIGAHIGKVRKSESFFCLLNIYNIVAAILIKLKIVETVTPFNNSLVPNAPQETFIASAQVSDTNQIENIADKEPDARPFV